MQRREHRATTQKGDDEGFFATPTIVRITYELSASCEPLLMTSDEVLSNCAVE